VSGEQQECYLESTRNQVAFDGGAPSRVGGLMSATYAARHEARHWPIHSTATPRHGLEETTEPIEQAVNGLRFFQASPLPHASPLSDYMQPPAVCACKARRVCPMVVIEDLSLYHRYTRTCGCLKAFLLTSNTPHLSNFLCSISSNTSIS
jgi:hypothetical protein